MRYRFIIILALSFMLTAPAAMAQPVPDDDALPDVRDASRQQILQAITGKLSTERQSIGASGPFIELTFSGIIANALARALTSNGGNTAVVYQTGTNNTAQITQRGQNNAAVMVQRGDFNTSTLLQDGSYNVYGSLLDGTNNTLNVVQTGSNNGYFLGFRGSDLNHTVMQDGVGNRAVQVGVGHKPFSIEQRGNNMDITVRHNGVQ
jgi:hypothetical protein